MTFLLLRIKLKLKEHITARRISLRVRIDGVAYILALVTRPVLMHARRLPRAFGIVPRLAVAMLW